MFSRDHLVIGALGFVLGGVVTTASISTILLTQQKEEKICPPVTVAPQAITQPDITEPLEPPPAPIVPPSAAPVEPKPIKGVAAPKTTSPVDTSKIKGIAGEEADKSLEDQKQLLARKQNLQSQLQDSEEIIRLKEQQIKEMEAKLQK
jgi:hypothetical protein